MAPGCRGSARTQGGRGRGPGSGKGPELRLGEGPPPTRRRVPAQVTGTSPVHHPGSNTNFTGFSPSTGTREGGETTPPLPCARAAAHPAHDSERCGCRNSGAYWPGRRGVAMFERPNQRPVSQPQPMESPRGGQEGRSRCLNRGAGPGCQSEFLRESGCGSPCAMEGKVLGNDALLQKLRDSRHRFQKHMQQLLEKVRLPTGPLGGARGRRGRGRRCWGLG